MFSIKHMRVIFSIHRRSNPILFSLFASFIFLLLSVSVNAQTARKGTTASPNAGKNYSMGGEASHQSATVNSMQLSGSNAPPACSQKAHDFGFTISQLAPGNDHCKAALVDISKDSAKFKSTATKTKCVINYYLNQCKGKTTDLDPVATTANNKEGSSSGVGAAGMAAAAAALAPVAMPLINEYFDKKGSGAASDGQPGRDDSSKTSSAQSDVGAPATSSVPKSENGFQQAEPSQMGSMQASGVDAGRLSSTSETQWDSMNPNPMKSPRVEAQTTNNPIGGSANGGAGAGSAGGGNPLQLPDGLSPEMTKQLESMTGTYNQKAVQALGEAVNELSQAANGVGESAIISELQNIPKLYMEASQSCGTAAERANTWCIEERSPGIKSAMTALSAGLPVVQAAMGSSDTCSKANQLMDVLSKGITLAQGTCAALKATCDITCARVQKNIQELGTKLDTLAQGIIAKGELIEGSCYTPPGDTNPFCATASRSIAIARTARVGIKEFATLDFTPKQPEAVAARVAKCGAYTETIVKTGLGLMSMAMSNKALKDCKEKTKAAASTDKCSQIEFSGTQECLCKRADMQGTAACGTANLDVKCAMEQYAATTECYCHKNPGVASCSGQSIAGLNMNGGQQKMTNGSGTDSTNGSLTGGGPSFGLDNPASKFAGKPSSSVGGDSSGGGGSGGALPVGGGGSGGMPSSDVSEKAKEGGLTAALQSFAGGFGFGNRDKKSVEAAKQALKNQRQQNANRSIASENGVTGPVGKSLWEKVRHTYGAKSSTLIEQ